jgi:hypothetical protein
MWNERVDGEECRNKSSERKSTIIWSGSRWSQRSIYLRQDQGPHARHSGEVLFLNRKRLRLALQAVQGPQDRPSAGAEDLAWRKHPETSWPRSYGCISCVAKTRSRVFRRCAGAPSQSLSFQIERHSYGFQSRRRLGPSRRKSLIIPSMNMCCCWQWAIT